MREGQPTTKVAPRVEKFSQTRFDSKEKITLPLSYTEPTLRSLTNHLQTSSHILFVHTSIRAALTSASAMAKASFATSSRLNVVARRVAGSSSTSAAFWNTAMSLAKKPPAGKTSQVEACQRNAEASLLCAISGQPQWSMSVFSVNGKKKNASEADQMSGHT